MTTKMNNAGKPWSPEENGTLIREYTVHQLDILEISRRHGRTPTSILCKLKSNNIIHNEADARGYNDYMEQKAANPEAFTTPRAARDPNSAPSSAPTITNAALLKEITDMKKEIHELHAEIRELTALMRASFEFEEVDA